jgi:hypothetical protein
MIEPETIPESIFLLDQYKEDRNSKQKLSDVVENFLSSDQRLVPAWV